MLNSSIKGVFILNPRLRIAPSFRYLKSVLAAPEVSATNILASSVFGTAVVLMVKLRTSALGLTPMLRDLTSSVRISNIPKYIFITAAGDGPPCGPAFIVSNCFFICSSWA